MEFNMREYADMLGEKNISIIYSGPIWAGGINGLAEMLIQRLEVEKMDESLSQSVFSIFVEQMNNMLMYSVEKAQFTNTAGTVNDISKGIFVLGVKGSDYFVQTGNVVKNSSAEILRERIDHLNTLDKKELRKLYKQKLREENDNPESQGAGVGLIEIARKATEPIKYKFEPLEDGFQYFTMHIFIRQQGGNE